MAFGLFIVYVVLSYIHPGEIIPSLAPYRVAYWIGMAGLAAVAVSLVRRRDPLTTNMQLCILVAFTAVMSVSLMVAERWLGAPMVTLQRFGASFTIFVLAMGTVTSMVRLRIAAACIIVLTMTLMLQGAAAYHWGYNTRMFLLDRGTTEDAAATASDDEADVDSVALVSDDTVDDATDDAEQEEPRIRGLGMMHDPNDLAMGMIVALGLIGGAWKARWQLRNVSLGVAAAALVYGIFLTRSRGGALALVVVAWRLATTRLGRIPALILLVVLGTGVLAVDFGGRSLSMEPDESANGRLVAWSEGLQMLKEQPILGVGYGQFVDHHTITAHNSLVLCFAETGLLGCFLWVGLFVVTLIELHRLKRLPGDEPFDEMARQWAGGLQLSLIGFMTAAFFLSRTFVPTLYLIFGLSAALAATARRANRLVSLPALPQLGTLVLACELASIGIVYTIVKLF